MSSARIAQMNQEFLAAHAEAATYPRVKETENYIITYYAHVSRFTGTLRITTKVELKNELREFYDMMMETRDNGEWDNPELYEMLGFESDWRDELLRDFNYYEENPEEEDDDEDFAKMITALKTEIVNKENKVLEWFATEYPEGADY